MTKKSKALLQEQIRNIEQGFSEAVGNGAFKNLKYAANLQISLDIISAFIESTPVDDEKEPTQSTNGHQKK